jgi:hypothetical protein
MTDYLWKKFNIKTFPAQTLVFVDGEFMPELSTISDIGNPKSDTINIDKKYDRPVHIIYVGEIAGQKKINIEISTDYTNVFLTTKILNKKPAFFDVFIKNTGFFSKFSGKIIAQNYNDLCIDIKAGHFAKNTGIDVYTKLVAHSDTKTKISGSANIAKNCPDCESDINFSVLAAPNAKIEFSPMQFIAAAPQRAEHAASLYRPTAPQIEYLRGAGLSGAEIKDILEESFINE